MEFSPLQEDTMEGSGGNQHHEDDPRRAALNNPVILNSIFAHLDTKNVKVMRLVCKAWGDAGSFILGERCRLSLLSIFDSTYKPMAEDVNPALVKMISTQPGYKPGGYPFTGHNSTLCIAAFASEWDNHVSLVEEIAVKMDGDINVSLPLTLKAFEFPNLRKIVIHKPAEIDLDFSLPFRCINTLKELKVIGPDFLKGCSYSLLQNLINSAPNLESLDVDGNFYPSLASSQKLKVLKWSGDSESSEWVRGIELGEVIRMINECGDHLQHLNLEFHTSEKFNEPFLKLRNLKSLTLNAYDLLELMNWICPELLPKLKMVSFDTEDNKKLLEPDQGCYLTHEGVSDLKLLEVGSAELIRMASKMYPNVKRLEIGIVGPKEEGQTEAEFLNTIFKACSKWKLLHLKAVIFKEFELSQFLMGLKSLSLLEGIKEVKIVDYGGVSGGIDDDLQEFKDVLQLSVNMKKMTFQGLELKPTIKEKVLKFLREHKDLPVFFLD